MIPLLTLLVILLILTSITQAAPDCLTKPFNKSEIVLNTPIITYSNSSSNMPVRYTNADTFYLRAFYSLTPFPGSISFNCPAPRYKGFDTYSFYVPKGDYNSHLNFTILSYRNFTLNKNIVRTYKSLYPINFNSTGVWFINTSNVVIPDNCFNVGSVEVLYNFTRHFYTYFEDSDIDYSLLDCNTEIYSCGVHIYPKYQDTCCYYNNKTYPTEVFIKSDDSLHLVDLECQTVFSWKDWEIATVVLASILFVVLVSIAMCLLCKKSSSYIYN